jgi:hypothetical protein
MALTAWPFADVDTTEAQYGTLFRQFQDDGLVGVPGDIGGSVTPVTGFTVRAAAFVLAYLGGVAVSSTSTVDVTLDAASASTRIDRVVVRIDAGDNVSIAVLKGTSGVSSPAGLTQVPGGIYEIPLARITVAPGTSTVLAADIVDERSWASTRNGKWTTATRPGTVGQRPAVRGDLGFNFTTLTWEGWNGTAWGPLASFSTPADVISTTAFSPAAGWAVIAQRFIKVGRVVSLDLQVSRSGADLSPADGAGAVPGTPIIGTINNPAFLPANHFTNAGSGTPGGGFRGLSIDAPISSIKLTYSQPGEVVVTGELVAGTFTYITAT